MGCSRAAGSTGARRGMARGKVREGLGGFEQNQRRRPACLRKHTTTSLVRVVPATVQVARRGGRGGGRRPPPPRGPAGAPEPRERRQPPQRSALRRALRHRLRKNQPAQAYRSQPWRRQSRRAQGGRGGGRGACARSGPRGRAAVGVTGKSMRASAAASSGGLSRSECTGMLPQSGAGGERSREL